MTKAEAIAKARSISRTKARRVLEGVWGAVTPWSVLSADGSPLVRFQLAFDIATPEEAVLMMVNAITVGALAIAATRVDDNLSQELLTWNQIEDVTEMVNRATEVRLRAINVLANVLGQRMDADGETSYAAMMATIAASRAARCAIFACDAMLALTAHDPPKSVNATIQLLMNTHDIDAHDACDLAAICIAWTHEILDVTDATGGVP
jgi:hypothetical protein